MGQFLSKQQFNKSFFVGNVSKKDNNLGSEKTKSEKEINYICRDVTRQQNHLNVEFSCKKLFLYFSIKSWLHSKLQRMHDLKLQKLN